MASKTSGCISVQISPTHNQCITHTSIALSHPQIALITNTKKVPGKRRVSKTAPPVLAFEMRAMIAKMIQKKVGAIAAN